MSRGTAASDLWASALRGAGGFFAGLFVLLAAAALGGVAVERAALVLTTALMTAALALPEYRRLLLQVSFGLLLALSLRLAFHLIADHFHYAYVWLYSAPELKIYLKLANLWGGEEGTLLFLALLLAGFALRLNRYPGWAGPGVILLALPFLLGLLVWHPFQMTSAAQLAHAPYQGMNAHLTKFWMAIHPPLIFIPYLLLAAPAGAAAEALIRGRGPWRDIALRYSRWAWVALSAGMVSGMWWAYEDFFYGQIWHWDPVQMAAFVVWCLLTAYLHGLRIYHPQGPFGRSLPFLGLLTAAAAIASLLVTRNGELVSSHRYLGETSVRLLAAIAAALFLLAWGGLILSLRRTVRRKSNLTEARLMIQVAIWGFVGIGLIGCYFLAEAYLRALLDIPKDKPPIFFALIANVSSADFVALLKAQHARWTVDNFAVNQMLAPLAFAVAIFGGHRFLPISGFWRRLLITGGAVIFSLLLAQYIRPLEIFYDGAGVTSGATRRNFFQLNMLLGAVIYFSLSSLLYALPLGVGRGKERAYFNYIAPVGLIHMGVMIGLLAALCATILDSNIVRKVTFPEAYNRPLALSEELSLRISPPETAEGPDGGYSPAGRPAVRALNGVQLLLSQGTGTRLLDQGHTLFRDDRRPMPGNLGPIRQYCEAVDYRFARISRSNAHMLNPFIYRGPAYDLQVWLPAVPYPRSGAPSEGASATYNVVVKKIPLMSGLWLGLGLSLLAGVYYALFSRKRPRS